MAAGTLALEVTVQVRLAAQEAKHQMRAADRWALASTIDTAAVAEGFPQTVTPRALDLSRRVLHAAAEDRWPSVEVMGRQIDLLRSEGGWFS